VAERSGGRPSFLWTPAHRTLEELVEAQAAPDELWRFMGNAWADFFAKLGAKDVAVAEVAVSALENEVRNCKLTFEFLSRAVQLISSRPEAQECDPPPPKPVEPRYDKLVLIAHDPGPLAPGSTTAVQCRRCLAVAKTPSSVKTLLKPGAKCAPPPMLQALAQAVEQMGWRSRVGGGDGVESAAAAAAVGAEMGGLLFECDGHRVHCTGPFFFCLLCGARVAVGSPKIDALGDACFFGPSEPRPSASQGLAR